MATYPLWGVVHGESVTRFYAKEFLLFPLVQIGQYPCQSGSGVWTLSTAAGGVVFPVEMPHGLPPILERLHSSHYAYCHDLDYRQSGFGQQLYPVHQEVYFPSVLFLRAPETPA